MGALDNSTNLEKDVTDYVSKIKKFTWDDIDKLWSDIEARRTDSEWAPGKALEHLVLKAFELEGANVVWPYSVPFGKNILEQIDGFVQVDGINLMVECKDVVEKMNIEPIAKLRSQLSRRPAGLLGCVFSYSGFTSVAIVLATYSGQNGIILWNGAELGKSLKNRSMIKTLREKYSFLLRTGVPDWTPPARKRK